LIEEKAMTGWKTAAALSLCLGMALSAQAANEPAKAKTESTWDSVKEFSHKEKERAVAAGKKLIAETDKKIAALAKDTKNATAETKAAHEANMKELQEKKKAAQAELDKLGKASGEAWDATKTGFSDAGKALAAAYDKAAAAVKK
jgi:predicted enzyme involved in methoxymalonyl-ACP biosynthesis